MITLLLGKRGLASLRGLFDEQALCNMIEREAIAFPNRSHGSRERDPLRCGHAGLTPHLSNEKS
jgi:hypothetical protein